MSTDYKKYRENLLRNVKERKSYVTYTPYIFVGKRRTEVELYTTRDYSKEEVMTRIDTDNALDYIAQVLREIEKYRETQEGSEIGDLLLCELSYFVESRVRISKNYRPNGLLEEDILDGVNCLTIYSPDFEDLTHFKRRTFVVDLDDLEEKLWNAGYETNISICSNTSKDAKEAILKYGPDASPYLVVSKSRELRETKDQGDKSLT